MPLALYVVFFLALFIGEVVAASPVLLQPGSYEVEVRLVLPHLDGVTASKIVHVCLAGVEADQGPGLKVLSDNNPLAHCPTSNLKINGTDVAFDIRCPGVNAAHASAVYSLKMTGFTGRITMKMGGKNMTMTEVQNGRRVGDCLPGGSLPK